MFISLRTRNVRSKKFTFVFSHFCFTLRACQKFNMRTSQMSTRILLALFIVCALLATTAHGQLLTRRQQFNLRRQQNQLDRQQDEMERQSTLQVGPITTYTYNDISNEITCKLHKMILILLLLLFRRMKPMKLDQSIVQRLKDFSK